MKYQIPENDLMWRSENKGKKKKKKKKEKKRNYEESKESIELADKEYEGVELTTYHTKKLELMVEKNGQFARIIELIIEKNKQTKEIIREAKIVRYISVCMLAIAIAGIYLLYGIR